jgi:Fe-Mn family superoxide dismutase
MFVLPDLPYAYDAFEPLMSADTLRTHHDKHHAKYVETTNQLLTKLGWRTPTLEGLILEAARANEKKLFNNAAQAWNHGFFWNSMAPEPGKPSAALTAAIDRDFGGLPALRERFVKEGNDHFASGWVWLAAHDGELDVISTHDADTVVMKSGVRPLLVCDVWEHAYYLDHKNDRNGFLEAWFDRLASWSFASRQLEAEQAWSYPAQTPERV